MTERPKMSLSGLLLWAITGERPSVHAARVARGRALMASYGICLQPPYPWRSLASAPMPKRGERRAPVILTWTNRWITDRRETWHVGEAYWHAYPDGSGAWWWANTSPDDYASDQISESITGEIRAWQPMPGAPGDPVDERETDDRLSKIAQLCLQNIEEHPGWLESKALVTARAHAWVLSEDLPAALSGARDRLQAGR